MSRGMKGLLPLGLFGGLIIILGIGLTRDPKILPSEMLDRPFPDFQLSSLYDENQFYTEADIAGAITLVNIFGSWCVACVQEHPNLVYIGENYPVRIVGVDWRDERSKAQAWLARYNDPYDFVLFDADSQLAIDLGVTGAPETFLVDSEGKIQYKHVGIITSDVWREEFMPRIDYIRSGG